MKIQVPFSGLGGSFHGRGGGPRGRDIRKVRLPTVAGSFYPADPKELARMVDEFLSRAESLPLPNLVALIAPHAGYIYSGPVAAWSYAQLKGRKVSRVVVISPSHLEAFGFSAVYSGDAYATPLGAIPLDRTFAAQLATMNSSIRLSDSGHASEEHALEVQLPFLQRVLGDFQLVPIVMGDQGYDSSRALGVALAKLMQDTDTMIVASSDLSHYHAYPDAVKLDRKTLSTIENWDYLNLSRNLRRGVWEACGGGPVVAAMIATDQLGGMKARVLRYANSGDTSGDRGRVVGYGAVALLKESSAEPAGEKVLSLSEADQDVLLEITRKSVEAAVRDHKMYKPAVPEREQLLEERGVFVTITRGSRLRGCVGFLAPLKPLYLMVRDAAVLAAVEDSRFPPVAAAELGELRYEISVLSPFRHVRDVCEIRVGRDGLLVRRGRDEGLLLPQVAVTKHWDPTAFLEETCRKAGLPIDAWLRQETEIFRFRALVFGDHAVSGAALRRETLVCNY